jgi:type II secretory ATPase GspE/PulE/Tfp pilus assembly ATPase PilB-like protein
MVMRVLDKSSLLLGLPELGFLSDDQETFERLLRAPDGIILVTGPTGFGKDEHALRLPQLHQQTRPQDHHRGRAGRISDERHQPGAGEHEIGMTFPAALRSILRQAPNIIMIGEIRDLETASIATNASLTGTSRLQHPAHERRALRRRPPDRYRVQPFLVATTIRAIMAQRLVRRLCLNCKEAGHLRNRNCAPCRSKLRNWLMPNIMRPVGCEQCRQTGYKGRIGILKSSRSTTKWPAW